MVGKISTGQYFKGVIDYNEKEKAEKLDSNLLGDTKEEMTKEFVCQAEQNERVKNKVKHFVLSFSDEDKLKLDNEKLKELNQEYLKRMGYGNNQFVLYKHSDTSKTHIHCVVNRVDNDGICVKDGHEKHKSRSVLMELEKKYNLTRTKKVCQDKSKQYDKTYKATKTRLNSKKEPTEKQIIEINIRNNLKESSNENEFLQGLQKAGIETIKNSAGNGYTFKLSKGKYKFKASKVHRDLSYSKIQKQLKENESNKSLKEKNGLSEHTKNVIKRDRIFKKEKLFDNEKKTKTKSKGIGR